MATAEGVFAGAAAGGSAGDAPGDGFEHGPGEGGIEPEATRLRFVVGESGTPSRGQIRLTERNPPYSAEPHAHHGVVVSRQRPAQVLMHGLVNCLDNGPRVYPACAPQHVIHPTSPEQLPAPRHRLGQAVREGDQDAPVRGLSRLGFPVAFGRHAEQCAGRFQRPRR